MNVVHSSHSLWPWPGLVLLLAIWAPLSHGGIEKLLSIRTCGKPNIQNIMNNVTVRPGMTATFKCQVDMSCIVAYIEWYHEMENGTEKLIKTASSSGDPHVHVIKEVKPTDEGLYTCIAGNFIGQATASAYLEVNAASSLSKSHCYPLNVVALLLSVLLLLRLRIMDNISSSPALLSPQRQPQPPPASAGVLHPLASGLIT